MVLNHNYGDYLNTLGEFWGLIASHKCDVNIVVGDFNVDFDRANLLYDFMAEFNLVVSDLSFRERVGYTYERDDGLAHSWIDNYYLFATIISDVYTVHCGSILSDHFPLFFKLHIKSQSLPTTKPRVLRLPTTAQLLCLLV